MRKVKGTYKKRKNVAVYGSTHWALLQKYFVRAEWIWAYTKPGPRKITKLLSVYLSVKCCWQCNKPLTIIVFRSHYFCQQSWFHAQPGVTWQFWYLNQSIYFDFRNFRIQLHIYMPESFFFPSFPEALGLQNWIVLNKPCSYRRRCRHGTGIQFNSIHTYSKFIIWRCCQFIENN